jgi:DNA-binding IclR family transcriptional regulator
MEFNDADRERQQAGMTPAIETKTKSYSTVQTAGMQLSYKPVGAIVAGLSVLRYLASTHSPVPLSRITKDLRLNPSTCLNILRTLIAEDYVVFDSRSKLYAMGLGVLELLGGAVAEGSDLRAVRALTDSISSAQSVTVTLWRRVRRDRIMLVLESLPAGTLSLKMNVGQRLPLLVGAAGRLMAAFSDLTEAELSEQYDSVRLARPMSFASFMAEVAAARDGRMALDIGRYVTGAATIAVPVLDHREHAAFVFSATMFAEQFTPERGAALANELQRPAKLLAAAVPYI